LGYSHRNITALFEIDRALTFSRGPGVFHWYICAPMFKKKSLDSIQLPV